jgi:hypothetical protein
MAIKMLPPPPPNTQTVDTRQFRNWFYTVFSQTNGNLDQLGTMAFENSNNIAITGGSIGGVGISGSTVNSTPIGQTTASAGKFTTLESTSLKTNTYQDFTPIATPSYQEGRVWYDSTQKTLSVDTDVANNNISLGLETQLKVYNATGSTIAAGACVYIVSGGSYAYPNVALAQANNPATSNVIGLTTGSIPNNSAGYVTTVGHLTGMSTGAIAEGTILYLSPYSAGQYMTTYPPTGYAVQVGVVAHQNTPNGVIYVKQSTPLSAGISVTITTAKLTTVGTNGSMTFTNGILTAQTQST